jgi:hypothetical protein
MFLTSTHSLSKTATGILYSSNSGGYFRVNAWRNSSGIDVPVNTSLPAWDLAIDAGADVFVVRRSAAGSTIAFSNLLHMTSTGLMGLGTAPDEELHVSSSDSSVNIKIDATPSTGQAGLKLIAGNGASNRATRIDFLNNVASSSVPRWTLINDYDQNGVNGFDIVDKDGNRVFRILQGGNVGIGTTSSVFRAYVGGSNAQNTVAEMGGLVAATQLKRANR